MVKDKTLVWPKFDTEDNSAGNEATKSADNLPVRVVNASTKFKIKTRMSFRLFSQTKSAAKPPLTVPLMTMPSGQTVQHQSVPTDKQSTV